jgi:HSP20 family protein
MRYVRYTYPNIHRPVTAARRFSQSAWNGLETEIDRLFSTAVNEFAGTSSNRFAVDLYEDKDNTYVRAELPGVTREDINIEVADGYLTIAATRKTPATAEGQAEQTVNLSRSLQLSEQVQADKIAASYQDGVLTVTLPKREESKPKKVTVEVK